MLGSESFVVYWGTSLASPPAAFSAASAAALVGSPTT